MLEWHNFNSLGLTTLARIPGKVYHCFHWQKQPVSLKYEAYELNICTWNRSWISMRQSIPSNWGPWEHILPIDEKELLSHWVLDTMITILWMMKWERVCVGGCVSLLTNSAKGVCVYQWYHVKITFLILQLIWHVKNCDIAVSLFPM